MSLAELRLCLQHNSYCNESSTKENKIVVVAAAVVVVIFPELAIHVFSGVICYKRSSNSSSSNITNIYNYIGNNAV